MPVSSLRTTSAVLLWVFKPDDAEHHVGADALQFTRPVDVSLLVEARVQFDHAGDLLARFGRPDQRLDERSVIAHPVDRHLDRDRQRIVCGLPDEALDTRIETVVRVVEQDVAATDRREDVGVGPARDRSAVAASTADRAATRPPAPQPRTGSCSRAGLASHRRRPTSVRTAPPALRPSSASAPGCTSRRTTGSNRRWRSSSSTIMRLLTASASSSSTSASRHTRNRLALPTTIPGTGPPRWRESPDQGPRTRAPPHSRLPAHAAIAAARSAP